MLKNKVKSRKSVQNRSPKKSNDRVLQPNIFELVSLIPKEINSVTVFENHKLNLKYAEILLKFCEVKIPEELNKLDFNKSDSLGEFIFSLTKLITDNKFTIVFDEENFSNSLIVDFNYKEIKYEWHYYVMEAKPLNEIKSQELKIGYSHLMKSFGRQLETSFTDHGFRSFSDSLFEYESDYIESMFDEVEIECDCETFEEYQTIALKPYLELRSVYDFHLKLPIADFHSYKPKNKSEQKLKDLISKGLEIDFSLIHRFPDNEMPVTDDGDLVSYSNSFMLLAEYTSELEQMMMERFHNDANNHGVTYPVNYYQYKNGKIIDGPSIQEEIALNDLCTYLTNLSDYFY